MLLMTKNVTESEHFTSLETLKSIRQMAKEVDLSGTDQSALIRSINIKGSVPSVLVLFFVAIKEKSEMK